MKPGEMYGLIEILKREGRPDGIVQALTALLQHATDVEVEKHGAFFLEAKTIFDVGANIGDSTRWFRKSYPDATIYSFEPITSTFAALSKGVSKHPLTVCERLALGSVAGQVMMSSNPLGTRNRIFTGPPRRKNQVEIVERVTGEYYCAHHGIDEIDILKIDTEGHDMEVLIGFRSMIARGKIKYIQVEAGMNPENPVHVNIRQFLRWLEPKGYRISSMHSPAHEKGSPVMRRSDIVFVYAPPPSGTTASPTEVVGPPQ